MACLIPRLTSVAMKTCSFNVMTLKLCRSIERSAMTYSLYCVNRMYRPARYVCTLSRLPSVSSERKYSSVVPFRLSDIGEGIREVVVKEWFVKVGDKVSQFDNICEVQSDKASVTITSRYDGTITKLHYNIDDTALVGEALVDLEVLDNCATSSCSTEGNSNTPQDSSTAAPAASKFENVHQIEVSSLNQDNKVLATPAVRRLASEMKVDLKNVSGTGRHGRVLKEDVLAYLEESKTVLSGPEVSHEEAVETSKIAESVGIEVKKPIRGFAKVMVKTMTAANMIPSFVYSDEINVTKISNIIDELKQTQKIVKFTFMPFFIKAASNCLLKYPILNSSVDEKCEHIIYKSSHNIGVAMDTPEGLVVPNIKNVEKLSILKIAEELLRLQKDGIAGSLRPSDLTGGTFTLSNIGSIGGTYTKPVILPPEVAIGGIGSVQLVPRFDELGNVVKTKIMSISWTADHRIIDGATMARFSNMWKNYIQQPYHLLLNL